MSLEFPQYRRYSNRLSYFKIWNENKFDEYKLNGKILEKYEFEVKILPDRNYLQDMLYEIEPYWEVIDETDFKEFILKYKMN